MGLRLVNPLSVRGSMPGLARSGERLSNLQSGQSLWRASAWLAALLAAGLLAACGDDPVTVAGSTADTTANQDIDTSVGGTDIQAPPDTAADTADTTPPDVEADVQPDVTPDTADTTGMCPGAAGCTCADDSKCDGGKCIDTPDGKKCAKPCVKVEDCASGYACASLGSTDATSFCVPQHLSICAPCNTNADCQVQGLQDSYCLDYGTAGKFCGGACTADSNCPNGYTCSEVKEGTAKQCKLKDTAATCECSAWAKAKGVETTCAVTNDQGSCTAKRKCGDAGLEACKAKTPAAETCNADDDNCDGKVDNLAADFTCFKKGFLDSGSKTACTKDTDCTTAGEACDEDAKVCKVLIGKCQGKPQCGSSGALICAEAAIPTQEICDGKDNNCDGNIDEGFAWKSPVDGSDVKVGAACGVGPCAGGTVLCKDNLTAVCTTYANAAKESCDGADNDCNGQTDDAACDDSDACTIDACDAAGKKCSNTAKDCADTDQCTEDKCDSKTGDCSHPQYSGSCSDGNACTLGDACGAGAGGSWVCMSGGTADKCDDNNTCTDDSCDPGTGCVHQPNAATSPCYTGKDGTQGVGTCKGGNYACASGQIDKTKCIGEVTPAANEACDGLDDNCNGQTDEGCKPTAVTVTFSSAYVSGNTGTDKKLQLLVGPSGPVGAATGTGKYNVNFGFLAWLMQLMGK
ncbi:MAG: hypothetical protein HY902_11385 [Deltaproteobacteria bacterium]|nr:hypothetical protein [Deltaproteobacteria bacterium]